MVRSEFERKRLQIILGALLVLASPSVGQSQLGPLASPSQAPQARAQEELDAYLEIVTEGEPQKLVNTVELFASRYPKSELLGHAFQYQMHAHERLGNVEGVVAAGEKALRAHPDNLNTLLTLAPAMANRAAGSPDRTKLLTQAEDYARRALHGIGRTQVPRKVPLDRWELEKQGMLAQAHEVLGVVAIQRGQPRTAIAEFETAVRLSPKPQGSQLFRLGLAYTSAGEKEKAESVLRRAAELGPDPVRKRALNEIGRLAGKGSAPGSSDAGICP